MEAAQIYNLDIAVAIAQIVQADAQVGVVGRPLAAVAHRNGNAEKAQRFGSRSAAQSSSGFGGSSSGGLKVHLVNFGLTASYMIDFWGKNRATLYAAEETATAARYNREVVTLTTIVTVANTYFQVLAAQDYLRVARRNLTAAERFSRSSSINSLAAPRRNSTFRNRKRKWRPCARRFRRSSHAAANIAALACWWGGRRRISMSRRSGLTQLPFPA